MLNCRMLPSALAMSFIAACVSEILANIFFAGHRNHNEEMLLEIKFTAQENHIVSCLLTCYAFNSNNKDT